MLYNVFDRKSRISPKIPDFSGFFCTKLPRGISGLRIVGGDIEQRNLFSNRQTQPTQFNINKRYPQDLSKTIFKIKIQLHF